jgi:homogentisate phytyltransferase/homogentisate geranylgeranyltransferase
VRTLSVTFGVDKIFWTCIALLEVAYLGAIVYCASRGLLWTNILVMAGHALMGALLWRRARTVDLKDIGYAVAQSDACYGLSFACS